MLIPLRSFKRPKSSLFFLTRSKSINSIIGNPIVFDPTLEWDSLPQNTFTELGQHTCNCSDDMSINEFESVVYLYPNPNKSRLLNIESTSPIQEINIYNLIGQSVFSKNFQGVMFKESITIDPSLNGVYFISVKLENNTRSLKKLILK